MKAPWTPMRWPGAWTDPTGIDRVKAAGIDTLLIDNSDEFETIRSRAAQMGVRVAHPDTAPDGVRIVKGEWPGVRASRGKADASAGPTGVPWVDSNGWVVRLSEAMHPDYAVWIDAAPPKQPFPASYLTALADSAAYGGRWIVALDDALAAGIARGNANALAVWKTIGDAARFFAARGQWNEYATAALVGVVSDFAGDNEFFGHELLNLLARAGLHFVVLRKDPLASAALGGARALLYADAQPPSADLRRAVMGFVESGGMLITTPVWGAAPASAVAEHPRYRVWPFGQGKIARAVAAPDDPYQMAQDTATLVSHRYDLVRFWNAGASGSYYAVSPDRKQAVAHLLFYADRGPDSATVRIAGPFRKAKASTVDRPEIPGVKVEAQKDAVEVYLPQVSQYVALELTL